MIPLRSSDAYSVPVSFAAQLVQLVRHWNVTPDDVLSGLGLTEDAVKDPVGRLPVTTYAALIERARTLTREPGLGFYLGLQKQISGYGYLGFAAMSASSLGEALEIVTRFTPMLTTSVRLALKVEGRVASLVVEEHVDMESTRDVVLISFVFGARQIGNTLAGRDVPRDYIDMAIPEPAYFPRFKHLMPNARFGQSATRVVFDAALLDLPLVQADPVALRLARDQCERALDALGFQGDVVERVRQAICRDSGEGFPSFEGVAAALAVSPRTLRRMLTAQSTSFSALLDWERREKAMFLLQASQVPLEEVAERLGYSTLSNFVRAFHRWTGLTPAAYRRTRSRAKRAPHASA